MEKILLIGLDGATFDLMAPWADAGLLPTFSRFLKQGAWGPLRSTTPPISPVAWSSFMTSTNPGQHGIYHFLARKPHRYEWYPVTSRARRGLPFWTWAGRQGRQAGVFNMPMTYPPDPIPNGYMVSGMGVPDVDVVFTSPPALQGDLLQEFGPTQLVEQSAAEFDGDTYGDYLLQTIDDNLEAMRYLLHTHPDTDLLCGVFIASDRAQHFYWQQMEDPSAPPGQHNLIQRVYQRLDRAVGALMADFPEYTVVIMSDHGAGPYQKLVDLNQWLAAHGWLRWQAGSGSGGRQGPAWRRWYRRLRWLLPDGVRRRMKTAMPSHLMQQVRAQVWQQSLPADWPATQAYSLGVSGAISLNQAGREPEGCVQAGADEQAVLDEIEAALYDLTDPETGDTVVESVHRGRDLYAGPLAEQAPELVVSWKPGYYALSGRSPTGVVFQDRCQYWERNGVVHSAEHRPDGIFLALGPGIRQGVRIQGASMVDLAPTVLHIMGLPIPGSMEGSVLTQILDEGHISWPVSRQDVKVEQGSVESAVYSADEEKEMLERLRDLGYLG